MHITDSGNHRVQMLSETGEYLAQWELPMPQGVQFESPVALTLGPNGNLYVSDIGNKRIYKLHIIDPEN